MNRTIFKKLFCFVLVLASMSFADPVTVPGTNLTLQAPTGWNTAPGQQGAVLTLMAPDGLAQIMINTMVPQNGMTLDQFFPAIHDGVVQSMTQNQASSWQSIEDSKQVKNGITFRFRNFKGTLGQSAGMQLGFAFAKTSSQLLVFNVAMDSSGTMRYSRVIRNSLLSLKDPSLKPEPVSMLPSQPSGSVLPPSGRPSSILPPPPAAAQLPATKSYTETTTKITLSYPSSWQLDKQSGSVTIGGPQGTPEFNTTINFQALDKSQTQNRTFDIAVSSFIQGLQGMGGKISQNQHVSISGQKGRQLDTVISQGQATYVIRYLLMNRPNVVGIVSFVAPANQWNSFLPTVQQVQNSISVPTQRPAATSILPPQANKPSMIPPTPVTTPQAAPTPATPEAAFEALRDAIHAGNWDLAVTFITNKGLYNFCKYWSNSNPEFGIDLTAAKDNPGLVLAHVLKNYPQSHSKIESFGKQGKLTGTRKHNDDMIMLKILYPGRKSENYFWMKRINGRWQYNHM